MEFESECVGLKRERVFEREESVQKRGEEGLQRGGGLKRWGRGGVEGRVRGRGVV